MSKRIDVTGKSGATLSAKGSGLIYTKELGWLDLGHARGTDIRLLLNQFRSGEAGTKEYYRVSYRQQMSYRGTLFNTGRYVEWEVKKGRTRREIDSIALAMMMHTASLSSTGRPALAGLPTAGSAQRIWFLICWDFTRLSAPPITLIC